jgi:hypothetical protein
MPKYITIYKDLFAKMLACTLCKGEGTEWSKILNPGYPGLNRIVTCSRCKGTRVEPGQPPPVWKEAGTSEIWALHSIARKRKK